MGDAPIANWQTSQWIFLSQKTSYHTLPGLWTWVVFFQQKLTLFFSLRYNHNLPFFSLPIISFQPKQENNRLYLASISLEEPLKKGGRRKRLPSFNFQCVATRSGHCSKAGRATGFPCSTLFKFLSTALPSPPHLSTAQHPTK